MKKSIVYAGLFAVLSAVQSVTFANYNNESYGVTALSAQKVAVQSCTPGINAVSRQIETGGQDIAGLLPFNRTYKSSLQLGFNPSTRSAQAQRIDEIFALPSIENRALFGAGWSHNYDYRLTTVGNRAYVLNMPGEGMPMVFAKQDDGSIKLSNTDLIAVSQDSEYKITDNGEYIVKININGMVVTFQSLFERRGLIQDFHATKIEYPGKRVVNMTYSELLRGNNIAIGHVLTGVNDNIGNVLQINRVNLSGADTSLLGTQLQGSISSVETISNPLNKQTATYSYAVTPVTQNGQTINLAKLTQVVTTIRGTESYIYNDYNHIGLFSDSSKTVRGVTLPLLAEYRHDNQTVMTWFATSSSLTSGSPGLFSASINYTENLSNAQLSITPPGATSTEFYTITNGYTNIPNINAPSPINGSNARYVRYTTTSNTPCLNVNGIPLKDFAMEKNSRTLATFTDKNNNRTDLQYDASNRLLEQTEAKGSALQRKTTMTYTTGYAIPSTIQTANVTLTNVVNSNGQIDRKTQTSSQADSTSKVTEYIYYSNGLLHTVNGPLAGDIDKVRFTYDGYGNRASAFQVVNGVTRTTRYLGYDSLGQPERIVYPTGLVDRFFYNPDGTVQSKVHGTGTATSNISGQTVSYTYDNLKRVRTETTPDGEVTEYGYDNLGRVSQTIRANGSITDKTYHPNGVVQSEETKDGGGTLFLAMYQELDANGRVDRVRYSRYNSRYWKRYEYDSNGNTTQARTPLGITDTWIYDVFNRVTSHTDGTGHTNTKSYDLQDNVTSAKDAVNSGSQPLEYINGQTLKKETNADFGIKTYSHDNADRITQVLHHVRQCSNDNIDGLGRIGGHRCIQSNIGRALNDTYIHDYSYSYDSSRFGRLDAVTAAADDGYGTNTEYSYDAYDRVIGKAQTVKAITTWSGTHPTRTVSYGYSTGGKLTSLTLPSGRQVQYVYDQGLPTRGQMQSIILDGSNLISSMSYNGAGQTASWTWGNGSEYRVSYDGSKNGSISNIRNRTASNVENYKANYTFDSDGRIIEIAGVTTRDLFSYDNSHRLLTENRELISSQAPVFGITYTYDQNGNRRTLRTTGNHQQPASSVNYTYQANTNRLATINRNGTVTSPTHLTEGELRLDFAGGYDSYGQRRHSGQLNNDSTQPRYYFGYNHKRERTVRSISGNGGSWRHNSRQYVYDENSRLLGEYGWDGRVFVEYVWKGDVPIAAIYGQGSATKVYYIITDAQNTPRRLIDRSNDQVVWAWDSTAFGVAPPSVETVVFNLRFPGQYYDAITKQHYNLNRYYNPEIGRYMEADPIGLAGGLNPYAYAGSNPVMAVDPSGLDAVSSGGYTNFTTKFADLPSFSISTPPQWKDYKNDSILGHTYNKSVLAQGLSPAEIISSMDYIINHPTPYSKSNPATSGGTYNNATPDKGSHSGFMANLVAPDHVYSYLRTGISGSLYVVNVTASDHSLRSGIVIRGIQDLGSQGVLFHNYGEGAGFNQSGFNFTRERLINSIWFSITQDVLRNVTGRPYEVRPR